MEIYRNRFAGSILKLSIVGLIFILSCGKVEEPVVGDGSVQWYVKLGFKEDMMKIKRYNSSDT